MGGDAGGRVVCSGGGVVPVVLDFCLLFFRAERFFCAISVFPSNEFRGLGICCLFDTARSYANLAHGG